MKNKYILIIGAVVSFLTVCIVFWPEQKSSPAPVVPANVPSPLPAVAPAPVQPPTAMAQPQPASFSNAPISTQRQFENMSNRERNAILAEIANQDLASIFHAWLDAGRVEHDPMKQGSLATTLAGAVQVRAPDPTFLNQVQTFIADGANSTMERSQLLGVLGEAATKESLDVLLQETTVLSDPNLKYQTMKEIIAVGEGAQYGDGKIHEELSLALEQVWKESQNQVLLPSVAMAMAAIGTQNGIELLVSSAVTTGSSNGVRKQAAQNALANATILNPHAIPPLVARLSNQDPTSATSKLASDTLARMGTKEATLALIVWIRTAEATAAPLAHSYVINAKNPVDIWDAAINSSLPFRSEQNREAIRTGLVEYRASRRFGP